MAYSTPIGIQSEETAQGPGASRSPSRQPAPNALSPDERGHGAAPVPVPDLMLVGVNFRRCPVADRERYSISETLLYKNLRQLADSPGIEEIVILSTCNRTEFILWVSDPEMAAASLQQFLAREYGLQLAEWSKFYSKAGVAALVHVFRVAASLDSMIVGEPEITAQVKSAWSKAQLAGVTGRFLDAVFQKALSVSKRVRNETAVGRMTLSVPYAAVALAEQIFGSLHGRKVLILGAGKMGVRTARCLSSRGASLVRVANRTYESAVKLAEELGGIPVSFEQRWEHLAVADVVISSTGCPHTILDRQDAERILQQRGGRPVFFIDIAVPRDIDPRVREVPGVFLYDIDDLEKVVAHNRDERLAAASDGDRIARREAESFRRKLAAERIVPLIVAGRECIESICRQELQKHRAENGPLSERAEQMLETLTRRLVNRLSGQLARELKAACGNSRGNFLASLANRFSPPL